MLLDPKREIDVNTLIREYLRYADYRSSVSAFDSECILKARIPQGDRDSTGSEDDAESQARLEEVQNRFVIAFRDGDRNEFFHLWDEHFPPDVVKSDPLYQKLEFQVSIYFAVFPIHPYVSKSSGQVLSVQQSMEAFKIFLETRGADLCKTTQFLSFYALPYVPDARQHPTFNEIFTERHVSELESRLIAFLGSALRSTHVPRILRILAGVDMRPVDVAADNTLELKLLKRQVRDHDDQSRQLENKHRGLQRDYHNLLTIASELVQTLAACINGEKITAAYLASIVQRVGDFKRNSLQQMQPRVAEQQNDVAEMEHSQESAPALPTSSPTRQRNTPVPPRSNVQTAVPPNLEAFLDYELIKRDLAPSSNEVQIRKQAFVLQAMRMRLTKSNSSAEKRRILREYISHDFLGISAGNDIILPLLQSGPHIVCEQLARFLNTVSSECTGREYLLQLTDGNELIPALVNSMMSESRDSLYQQNLLGTLQKLSLRRSAQSTMNHMNVLKFLHHLLENSDSLSDYSCEYGTALFMNLCLRTQGRKQCLEHPPHTLEVLLGLLEIDSMQIQTYVNGALYSLLSEHEFRECAKEMRLDESLLYLQKTANEQVRGQINFVLEQMSAGDDEKQEDETASEDGDDEDEENDEEEHEAEEDFDELIPSLPKDSAGINVLLPYFNKRRAAAMAETQAPTNTAKASGGLAGANQHSTPPINRNESVRQSVSQSIQQDLTRPKTPTSVRTSSPVKQTGNWSEETNVAQSVSKVDDSPAAAAVGKKRPGNVPKNDVELREFNTGFTTRPKLPRTPLGDQ
ncbi:LisH domain-containing protein armc9 [Chytriomyces hyalinus]|nr:LisH domain-containing protein armc9 [Chytriomyces hyalinus]